MACNREMYKLIRRDQLWCQFRFFFFSFHFPPTKAQGFGVSHQAVRQHFIFLLFVDHVPKSVSWSSREKFLTNVESSSQARGGLIQISSTHLFFPFFSGIAFETTKLLGWISFLFGVAVVCIFPRSASVTFFSYRIPWSPPPLPGARAHVRT